MCYVYLQVYIVMFIPYLHIIITLYIIVLTCLWINCKNP